MDAIKYDKFRQALAIYSEQNNEADIEDSPICEPEFYIEHRGGLCPVASTRDEVAVFCARWGKPETDESPVGTLYVWEKVQTLKGRMRGTLHVMDFGDERFAYFDGE